MIRFPLDQSGKRISKPARRLSEVEIRYSEGIIRISYEWPPILHLAETGAGSYLRPMTAVRWDDRHTDRPPPRAELTRVALRSAQHTRDGRDVPAGAAGTVVDVLAGGRAYIVEFVRPFAAIVTVEAQELETVCEG